MSFSDLHHWIRGLQETANHVREALGAVSAAGKDTPVSQTDDQEPT